MNNIPNKRSNSVFLLLALILVVYSNSFDATWHLDDRTNIVDNPNVHVSTLSLNDWVKSARPPFSAPEATKRSLSKVYRPVAMVSFALNWFFGGLDVFGYHLVNVGIHGCNSVLLFFIILNLFKASNREICSQESEHFIALLATVLWSLHPIQIQAVTYIVQRMSSLATFFYLLAIFFFLKARLEQKNKKKVIGYGVCIVSFALALGSKENAITLPGALLLIEIVFFQQPRAWGKNKFRWKAAGIIASLFLFLTILLFLWQKNPLAAILHGYQIRPFTLTERMLTEFRVVLFYLYQLFYPVPGQFSIMHDFELSRSLLQPWTTITSLIIVITIIVTAIAVIRKMPILSFAILFFFLGHSVESTIFPLELVFEHRNYLPSLFIFLPVAQGLKHLLDYFEKKSRAVYAILTVTVVVTIVILGLGTYTRNIAWATEKNLWKDAVEKAPGLARPYQNLAQALEREGQLNSALRLYLKALDLRDPDPKLSRFISMANIGNIYKKKMEYRKAAQFLSAAVQIEKGPYAARVRYNLVLCLLNLHRTAKALDHIEHLLSLQKDNSRYLAAKGFILMTQGRQESASRYFRLSLKRNPFNRDALLNLAMTLSHQGFYERAEWFLRRAMTKYRRDLLFHLAIVQNAITMKDNERIHRYLSVTTHEFTLEEIRSFFLDMVSGRYYINETLTFLNARQIIPYLNDFIKEKEKML